MTLLAPAALALLGLLPVVVLFYILKRKRDDVLVSSTLLWRRTLRDLAANVPFQRLRKNLLLLLQLLILAGLVLALARPAFTARRHAAGPTVLLVDRSASMNAREGGETRLERARRAALDLVRGLREGERAALIAFAARPEVLAGFTEDRAALERGIGAIRSSALPTDLGAALELARSLAGAERGTRIVVVGDGAYGDLSDLPFETRTLSIEVLSVGETAENAGIVSIEARRDPTGERAAEIYAGVRNEGRAAWTGLVTLLRGGRAVDAKRLAIEPGAGGGALFRRPRDAAGLFEVRIAEGGALGDDDRAWIRVREPAPIRVALVTEGSPWLEALLAASPLLEAVAVPPGAKLPDPRPDVIIYDGAAPEGPLEEGAAIFVGCAPPLWTGAGRPASAERPLIIDWDRESPVTRFAAFGDLRIERSLVFPPAAGYRSLLDADAGSIAGTFAAGGARGIAIGFRLEDSNWPLTYSVPIFFLNALRAFGGDPAGGAGVAFHTGEPLRLPAGRGAVVVDPDGREHRVPAAAEPVFGPTDRAGLYRARLEGGEEILFPVNLADADEARIAPEKRLDLGRRTVEVRAEPVPETRETWRILAALAFALLLLEWFVYNRRLTG